MGSSQLFCTLQCQGPCPRSHQVWWHEGNCKFVFSYVAHFHKGILIHMPGIAERRTTFWCIWRESFNEAGTCCKKGGGNVWTSENKAARSTQVSFVYSCWEEEFWCLWLVILIFVDLCSIFFSSHHCCYRSSLQGLGRRNALLNLGLLHSVWHHHQELMISTLPTSCSR